MKKERIIVLMLIAALSGAACNQVPWPSREFAFDGILVGKTTRAEVFATMGTTPQRTLYNIAGLEVESLVYEDTRHKYEIRIAATPFTEPTVITKTLVPKEPSSR